MACAGLLVLYIRDDNMKKYEVIPEISTADLCIKSYGKTLEEAFENLAFGMFETMVDTKKIRPKIKLRIEKDAEDLVFDWLSELLYLHDSKGIFFCDFMVKISKDKGYRIVADVSGGPLEEKPRREVKAVTYHMMEINEEEGIHSIRVVLDM